MVLDDKILWNSHNWTRIDELLNSANKNTAPYSYEIDTSENLHDLRII